MFAFPHGTLAYTPDGRYRITGELPPGAFGYSVGLVRFTPEELIPWYGDRRLPDDFDPWA